MRTVFKELLVFAGCAGVVNLTAWVAGVDLSNPDVFKGVMVGTLGVCSVPVGRVLLYRSAHRQQR